MLQNFSQPEPSDSDLALQISAGPAPDAEAELFRRMAPRVRLYGLRHLRDHAAADDLTQHVLLTVLEALRLGRLREPAKLPAFVLGTCRMAVLDIRRNASRKDRLLQQFSASLPLPAPPAPRLDHDQLTHCLQNLKERDRSVVVMTFYDDESAAGVAASLGISEANVRIIRHRALHQLRHCLGVTL